MTTVPAIRGKLGNIEYYQCTMNAHDLITRTQNATEYFSKEDWKEMGDWGKNQREVDKRYLKLIAPYILRDKDRFFNSFIVKYDSSLAKFTSVGEEPIKDKDGKYEKVSDKLSFEKQDILNEIGFLNIKDKGTMVVLDGQHRLRAIRAVIRPSDQETKDLNKIMEKNGEQELLKNDNGCSTDMYSVIFVNLDDRTQERKLFTDINTYAKVIGKKEQAMLSETDGYYKICQKMGEDDRPIPYNLIYSNSTSLPDGAAAICTLHHLANMVEKISIAAGPIYKFNRNIRQPKENIEKAGELARIWLREFFTSVDAYKHILDKYVPGEKPNYIVDLRKKDSKDKWGLLLKPLPQIALVDAIIFLKRESDLDDNQIYAKINKIDWSYDKKSQFENMVITPESNILTGGKITARLTNMILFWVLGKKKFIETVGQEVLDSLISDYNTVNSPKVEEFPEVRKR